MKCKKIMIETDGTSINTIVKIDGKQLKYVRRIEFLGSADDKFINVSIEEGKLDSSGNLISRKVNVRDKETQKFVEKEKIITEPLLIEFENV